jgi:hypothetical protein
VRPQAGPLEQLLSDLGTHPLLEQSVLAWGTVAQIDLPKPRRPRSKRMLKATIQLEDEDQDREDKATSLVVASIRRPSLRALSTRVCSTISSHLPDTTLQAA